MTEKRIYEDGRIEWRTPVDPGWTRIQEESGRIDFEEKLKFNKIRRGNRFGEIFGDQIRWDNGPLVNGDWDRFRNK